MNPCIHLTSDVGLQISDSDLCFGDIFMYADSLTFVPYGKMLFVEVGLRPRRGQFRTCSGLLRIGGVEIANATNNLVDSPGPAPTAHELQTAAFFSSHVRDQECGAALEARVAEHGGLTIGRCSIKSVESRGSACILAEIDGSPPWVLYALDCDPGKRDSRNEAGRRLKAMLEAWVGTKIQAQPRADLNGVNVGVPFKHFAQRLDTLTGVKCREKTIALAADFVERTQRDCGFEEKVIRTLLEATSDGSTVVGDQWLKLEPKLWAFYVSRIKGCYHIPKGEQPPEYADTLRELVKKKFHKRREELRRWADTLDTELYTAICADAADDWIGLLFGVVFFIVVWLAIAIWCLLSIRTKHEGSEGYTAAIKVSGLILLIPAGIMAVMAWKRRHHWQSLLRIAAEGEVKTRVDDDIAPHIAEEHTAVSAMPTHVDASSHDIEIVHSYGAPDHIDTEPVNVDQTEEFKCPTCGQVWASNYCPQCCHTIDRSADAEADDVPTEVIGSHTSSGAECGTRSLPPGFIPQVESTSATPRHNTRNPVAELVGEAIVGAVILLVLCGSLIWKGAVVHNSLVSGVAGPIYLMIWTFQDLLGDKGGATGFEQALDATWRAGTGLYRIGFILGAVAILSIPRYVGALLALLRWIGEGGG